MLIITKRVLKIIAITDPSLYFVMLYILIKVVKIKNKIQAYKESFVIKNIVL